MGLSANESKADNIRLRNELSIANSNNYEYNNADHSDLMVLNING